ncbi:hypothetical protein CKA32_000653 [Geitlerinema sp. FC II]|nr:hypothetical protein CKA32_000653 [Geitlerinema sp. FC II]
MFPVEVRWTVLFQSLEGIFGFFNVVVYRRRDSGFVSIPRRDFWVFQPSQGYYDLT